MEEFKRSDDKVLSGMTSTALFEYVHSLEDTVASLSNNVANLTEQIRIMNERTYGRKTETAAVLDMPQLDLGLNEAESLADEKEPEPVLEEAAPKKKKAKGKKATDLQKITNHRDEYIELTDEELNKKYGEGKWKHLPYEIINKLEHLPASFEAVTYHIGVYARNDDQTIVRAPHPTELFPKSIATPSLVASILYAKYVKAIPLYRLEQAYQQNDVSISRAVMANWVIKGSQEYLIYLYDAMKKAMVKQSLIHADETPFEVIKDGRPAGSKSYMWVYRTNAKIPGPKAVLYDYCATRGHQNPERFLEGYKGTVVCDGYGAYHQLEREHPESYKVAGCWVHLKRKFASVVKAAGPDAKPSMAEMAVVRISSIYRVEHEIEDLPAEEKLKKRQERVKPIVDNFFEWIRTRRHLVDSASATGQGFTYALNQEKYLRAFLDDPDIPLDNNAAEIAIRPFTIGRKNWVLIDTPRGAAASAVIYSIVETAKANNLRLYQYLVYLLEELPKYINSTHHQVPEKLLPWSDELPKGLYMK